MSKQDELERRLDLAADLAVRTRERIEAAVDAGEVPAWVMDACSVLERSAMQYGELSERLKSDAPGQERTPVRTAIHVPGSTSLH